MMQPGECIVRIVCLAAALTSALAFTGSVVHAQEAAAAAPGKVPPASTAVPVQAAPLPPPGSVVPPVRDRDTAAVQKITVRGFHVSGVGSHTQLGITPASIQALADAQFRELAAGADTTELSFAQMQGVADKITERYRTAGFIVSNAFLPAQTIGSDQIVGIQVLEGQIGKIIVKGTKRYRPGIISAAAQELRGKPLLKSDVDSALLYARDLPGVTVASTFQPGEQTGDTDLTGKYSVQAGMEWANPLHLGDTFTANVDYALDPNDNIYGALTYRVPLGTPGLSMVVGASRNELQINTGTFAALDVKGPSSLYYGGLDWKYINRDDLQHVATLHVLRERSQLDSLGFHLSDEKFTVAETTWGMLHTDRRFHGVDIMQLGLRKSIRDDSREPDLISPQHDRSFLVAKLSYTRLQFLTKSQRLNFKFIGQYTRDALVPLEQFAMGGPDSVRSYPIADALRDRGFYTSLEYHVDAPGFGDKVSPFYGRPWRELLEFEVFYDYAKGYSAGANRAITPDNAELSGAGAGFIFRLPRFKQFELHFDAAKSTSSQNASNGKGFHIYTRFSFTF
jgi:hemolysin activation/secretion protein